MANRFMGLFPKSSKHKESHTGLTVNHHHRHAVDDLEITHSPKRSHDGFAPNPEIPPSPNSNGSEKKGWEGDYQSFLSSKGSSPDSLEAPTKSPNKKSVYSIIPGSRLVVQKGPPSRSSSDGLANSRRSRNHSSGSDELDSAMRHGMIRPSPDYSTINRKNTPLPPQVHLPKLRTSSHDDAPSGLDELLASGSSSSPHFIIETGGVVRHHSYGSIPTTMHESSENIPSNYAFYLPKRDSAASFSCHQTGLNLDEDSFNSSTSSEARHFRSRSADFFVRQGPAQPQLSEGGIGSLLEQDDSTRNETEFSRPKHHPQHLQNHLPLKGRNLRHHPPIQQNGTLIEHVPSSSTVGGLGAALQMGDGLASSGSSFQNGYVFGTPPSVDPQQKREFTAFHSQARDSTSAFLGSEIPSPIGNSKCLANHTVVTSNGFLMPFQAHSATDLRSIVGPLGSSLSPLETVDENHISIHKSMRLLKAVTGTESWEPGRRYLIAPAALAACPLSVVSRLSGGPARTAKEAAEETPWSPFGSIVLGDCLMTYTGETHHLSLGQYSQCKLVLRQNYLLEFDISSSMNSIPRGYIHLQHSEAHISHFQNYLELDFYASPCAKADKRKLLIRTDTREECTYFVKCLNKAAGLKIKDLWDFAGNIEFGRGRYAAVYPARRKIKENGATTSDNEAEVPSEPTKTKEEALLKYNCALKIIEKSEFWRRVVKGQERADTLVRETSVQAALTAKCGKLGSFLQLRGLFETSENVVMELELLEGTDLFNHVSSKRMLSEHEAATILRDILISLDAMDHVGVAHRDIKAANILMCDRSEHGVSIKVGDFGMSTFVGHGGLVHGRCGTPGFVAPEILMSESRMGYGKQVDIFSAGVTLYVMLCGYEPFYGKDEKELIEANRRAKIDFPEDEWGRISNDARDLVLKMTQADPKQRISAKDALKHPWIGRLDESNGNGTFESKPNALSASDIPQDGACIIS